MKKNNKKTNIIKDKKEEAPKKEITWNDCVVQWSKIHFNADSVENGKEMAKDLAAFGYKPKDFYLSDEALEMLRLKEDLSCSELSSTHFLFLMMLLLLFQILKYQK